jgi:Fe-S-cluster containining protein
MTEEHTTLVEVKSGKIELVFNRDMGYSTLQFNCECTDAMPYCKAMCCRLRQGFSVLLRPDEISKYKNRPFPRDPELRIVDNSPDGKSCYYLDSDEAKCTIHGEHPQMCKDYHCSPEGKGFGVKYRDGGWLWTPMNCLQQMGDGSVIDLRKISKVNLGD